MPVNRPGGAGSRSWRGPSSMALGAKRMRTAKLVRAQRVVKQRLAMPFDIVRHPAVAGAKLLREKPQI